MLRFEMFRDAGRWSISKRLGARACKGGLRRRKEKKTKEEDSSILASKDVER